LLALLAVGVLAFAAQAQDKVILGMSGWTGFQPLKLAELAGIFKKNGVDMEIRFIAPVQRSAALPSGALNAAATTVDQHIVWASAGIPSVQVALIDKSKGGDGLAVRNNINSIKDLKGKSVNVDGPGTVQHFMLSYILEKNGMSIQDVIRSTMGAQPAAQAFVAGQCGAHVRALPLDRAREARRRQDPGHLDRIPGGGRCAGVPQGLHREAPEGGEGHGRQLLRGARSPQARSAQVLRADGQQREA